MLNKAIEIAAKARDDKQERSPFIGKSATAAETVTEANTAKAVGSGSLDVYSTPMMVALMERAACECLSEMLNDRQTSVGTQMLVEHTAASPIGTEITAKATVDAVLGRNVELTVTASDASGEIGRGKHTRVIIDEERFMAKVSSRGQEHHP